MDGNDRRRSQYGQPYQTPSQSRPLPGQSMGPPSSERYAQSTTPARSDVGRASIARPYVPSYPGYGFQEQQYGTAQMQGSSPMQGVEMQYPPAYIQDASRQQQVQASPTQQQQQQYAQYGAGSMLPPVGAQSMYGNIPYQERQTAIEVMASQFAVPQYMPHGGHAGMGEVGSSSSQYMTSQPEQAVYGAVPVTRAPLHQTYAGGQVDFPEVEQQATQAPVEPDVNQEALDEGFRDYRQQIRSAFDFIVAGRVTEASERLLAASRWLASSITALGLHHDDEGKHSERIELWRELNLCWEALGQKQREITEEALRTTRLPADILSSDNIVNVVDELIGLCDQVEQYGLVDFEIGIWEEQITHIFTVCLDLLPRSGLTSQSGRGQAGPS
ncbi:hypothetical protein EDD36DRAFT_3265 [Exophiala viscosa]|uniref:Uncharacterized protein n=1 Tax=Exophiala viscosa TaxID=2486360 RepID=A0AAN6E3J2_9EURO|nr:hypothetical protein EDD36DRAFT_3265 [Exophiala viscosa]